MLKFVAALLLKCCKLHILLILNWSNPNQITNSQISALLKLPFLLTFVQLTPNYLHLTAQAEIGCLHHSYCSLILSSIPFQVQ